MEAKQSSSVLGNTELMWYVMDSNKGNIFLTMQNTLGRQHPTLMATGSEPSAVSVKQVSAAELWNGD